MGYYDFDDHFWSPREVCAQAPQLETRQDFFNIPKLLCTIFTAVFRFGDGVVREADRSSN